VLQIVCENCSPIGNISIKNLAVSFISTPTQYQRYLSWIDGLLLLTQGGFTMSEVSVATLWKLFKEDKSQKARSQIIERYAHLFGQMPSGIEKDDLVSAGVVGLIKAVDQFDPNRGIKFETYAITLIRGAILEMLRGDDWVPRLVRDQQKQLKQAQIRLEARSGRPASEAELAREMGISSEKLDKLLGNIGRTKMLSLDDFRPGDSQRCLADMLPTDAPSPLECVVVVERCRTLTEAVKRLPDRERTVVALYYHECLTFKEIGGVLTVSESRAYQLHGQAVSRLCGYLKPEAELFAAAA
jgi:RNA polymerase sigma factor FliA